MKDSHCPNSLWRFRTCPKPQSCISPLIKHLHSAINRISWVSRQDIASLSPIQNPVPLREREVFKFLYYPLHFMEGSHQYCHLERDDVLLREAEHWNRNRGALWLAGPCLQTAVGCQHISCGSLRFGSVELGKKDLKRKDELIKQLAYWDFENNFSII